MAEAANQRRYDEDEINLLDYWRVIWKYKWMIGILCITSFLATLVFSFRSPKIYVSTATILRPQQTGGGGLLSALGRRAIQQIPSFPSFTPNRNIFLSVLKSRTLARKMVDHYNLMDYYRASHLERAVDSLSGATRISESDTGIIEIKVRDKDPKIAADIANGYVNQLDRFISESGIGAVNRQRRFISDRIKETQKNLAEAEVNLQHFQENNRTIVMSAQTSQAMAVAARLKGEIISSEIKLEVMGIFATDSNPEVIRLGRQIAELKHQLAQAQYGAGLDLPAVTDNPGHSKKEIYLSASRIPKVSLDMTRLTRDIKVHETVYTMLTQQLEQAKIAEAKDMPMVQVLDRAVPALHHFKPKPRRNALLAGAIGLFLGTFLAFLLEYIQRQKQRIANS